MTHDPAAPSAATAPEPAPDDDTGRRPFARLADELSELGFDGDDTAAGPREFAATDSDLTAVVDDSARPPRAVLTNRDGEPDWEIALVGDVPDPTPVMVLYAALNPHDPAAAAAAATAALAG